MIAHLEKMIEVFSVKIEGKVTSPAMDKLFVQIPNDKWLIGERKDDFIL